MLLRATFAAFDPLSWSLFLGFPTAGIHGILTRACLVEIEIQQGRYHAAYDNPRIRDYL
jgi:hypothetical protein